MKKLLSIAIILFAVSSTTFAQVQQEEVDYYQSVFGMEKKVVVANFIGLDDDNAFWSVYDEYEKERKKLGQRRLTLILEYAKHYEKLTDDKTDELVKESMSLRKANQNLINKYYKKVKKLSGSKIAAQFYQIENYFITAIHSEIYTEVPLVGELEK